MDIVIVGGSIAGLMHGVLLKSLGHNIHIIEQWKEEFRHGEAAGIRAGPQCQQFFQRFDQTQQPYFLDCPGLNFINKAVQSVKFINSPMAMTSWTTLYYRLRANFDGYRSDQCPHIPTPLPTDGQVVYDLGKRALKVSCKDTQIVLLVEDLINGGQITMTPDLIIAADGSNSTIRNCLVPALQRPYAGYVAWRGCVPECHLTAETRQKCAENFTVFKMSRNYILVYKTPGSKGSLKSGECLMNWVWYSNVSENSSELTDILTDKNGHRHKRTLPPGLMRAEIWQKQIHLAKSCLPSLFAELVEKTAEPFVTSVSDCLCPRASFFDGKVLLVGDALAQFRPHIALSANQAAYNALQLEKLLTRQMSLSQWESLVLQYARETRALSTMIGDWTQNSLVRAFVSALGYIWIRVLGIIIPW